MNAALQVPVLAKTDMYCEKLLANADRYADKAVLNRDIIDLGLMMSRWGQVPQAAWDKARLAYGTSVDAAYSNAVAAVRNRPWLEKCMRDMGMDQSLAEEILAPFDGPGTPGQDSNPKPCHP